MQRSSNVAPGLSAGIIGMAGLLLGGLTLLMANPASASHQSSPAQTHAYSPSASASGAVTCTYVYAPSAGTIISGTEDTGNHGDDVVTAITLPFAYTLYDMEFTTANVSSNGVLEFASNNVLWKNGCLPQPDFEYSIFAYWDDLRTNCAGCGVFTSVSGEAPNRIFNIEWRAETVQTGTQHNFEIRLYENQTRFDIVYGAVPEGGISATVGVERDQSPTGFTQYECNTGGVTEGLQLVFTLPPCGTATVTPTSTSTSTATPTASSTSTPSSTATETPSPTFSSTDTATATATPTSASTDTATTTSTSTSTQTASPALTPTDTATASATPTNTHTAMATFTPTSAATRTFTPVPTNTPLATPTECDGRVTVCHQTGWSRRAYIELTISCRALPAHLRHGDVYPVPPGGCPMSPRRTIRSDFYDVHIADFFYDSVMDLTQDGVVSGYADNTFRPYLPTTRAQLVKMVVIGMRIPLEPPRVQHFTDVPFTHPFFSYVETAYSHGLISGYADGTFRPYDSINRGQITKVVVLASEPEILLPSSPSFVDVPVGSTFYPYIETAYANGMVGGYADRTFRANLPATRGQVSKIIDVAGHP
ncbi:MAG: S-layer homology domain-containing protein [Chloroflexia bacterium]